MWIRHGTAAEERARRSHSAWWLADNGGFVPEQLPPGEYRKKLRPFWWVVHNCIAHPILGLCPMMWAFRFHDWTGAKKEST